MNIVDSTCEDVRIFAIRVLSRKGQYSFVISQEIYYNNLLCLCSILIKDDVLVYCDLLLLEYCQALTYTRIYTIHTCSYTRPRMDSYACTDAHTTYSYTHTRTHTHTHTRTHTSHTHTRTHTSHTVYVHHSLLSGHSVRHYKTWMKSSERTTSKYSVDSTRHLRVFTNMSLICSGELM